MRTLTPLLSNWLWVCLNTGQYRHFLEALNRVEAAQSQYLLHLVRCNAKTKYGMRHHFTDISSVEEYQQAVPLTDYEDYSPYIEEISHGQSRVLTCEPVLIFEPSSGTSSASKLIPYTRSLKLEFQRGIAPWAVSLFKRKPELLRGLAYWSISPANKQKQYYCQVLVGFAQDAEYLGFVGKWLYSRVTAVPPEVAYMADVDTFRRQTLVHLLAAEKLAFISVWSPTFLTLLLRHLVQNQDEILSLLMKSELAGASVRATTIKSILRQEQGGNVFERIWPNLAVISCWTHGPSEIYANETRKHFPNVEIQGKGLLATEAFVSLPFLPDHDPVLAVDSHFFEFRDTESSDIRLAHQVEKGKVYSVNVSTMGGLYRYRLGDLVKVTGFIGQAPTLRFVTKEEAVSDLFGEKLHSDHVQHSAADTFSECSVEPLFFLLAPVKNPNHIVAYSLFLHVQSITMEQSAALRDALEERLCENFHYAWCRNVGQLGALRIFLISGPAGLPEEIFTLEIQRRGLKLGDIKPTVLDREAGWEHCFPGHFVDGVASTY